MIFTENFKILSKDIGKDNLIINRGILEIFENLGLHHADLAGHGANDIKKIGLSWIVLDWKVKVLKRPKYGQNLTAKTWGRVMDERRKKLFTYREFEIFDEEGNLCVIATSKWVMMDINTWKLAKLGDEILEKYGPEDKYLFDSPELERIKVPTEFSNEITYKVSRKDIDYNGHVHNLYYLDLAYEALPEDVFNNRPYDNFRINYKKEIKYGDLIKCKYSFVDGKHFVTICGAEDEKKINAIVELF